MVANAEDTDQDADVADAHLVNTEQRFDTAQHTLSICIAMLHVASM